MRIHQACFWAITLLVGASPLLAQYSALPQAEPPYYRVQYEPSAGDGELAFPVSYTIWIPPDTKQLRGIIVHQHGCGEGACKAGQTAAFDLHWQALATRHNCALLGPSYEQPEKAECQLWCDPRYGSGKRYLDALKDLSKTTGHPELETVPWALWGHSGGATWVGIMLMLHPDRIAAVWLRSGAPRLTPREGSSLPALEVPTAAYSVPAMCNLGTQEGVTVTDGRFAGVWKNVETFFTTLRSQGALIGVSVDPKSSHDCGNQRYLAILWFDACLAARLPPAAQGSIESEASAHKLRPMPADACWLAPLLSNHAEPVAAFKGERGTAVWLPNESVAKVWEQYSIDTNIVDATPPPAPSNAKLHGNELAWTAVADLESGLAAFIIERDGKEIGRLPETMKSSIGRPIFQRNSYSDTPSPPLAEMKFIDREVEAGKTHQYRITALNSVGLRSAATVVSPSQ